MLKAIQEAVPPERYTAQYSEMPEYYIQGYFVLDTFTGDFVKDKDNFPIKYDNAKEALDAARQMDKSYKNATQNKNVSAENKDENVTESVTSEKNVLINEESDNQKMILSDDKAYENAEEKPMRL